MATEELEVDIPVMCLKWTVDTKSDQDISSSEFRFQGGRWTLNYFKIGKDYCLALCQCSGVHPNPLHVSACVESCRNGKIVNVLPDMRHFTDEFEEEDDQYIWCKRKNEILRSVPEFRQHGVLKLIVVLKVEGLSTCACHNTKTSTDASVQTRLDACSISSLETLSEDIFRLQNSDLNPDVEIHCGGRTAKVHRALLCVRSPVLATMLQTDMQEGRTGIVNIRGMDTDTFHTFLKHLHTGKLEHEALTFDASLRLYEAGKMYQVESLSSICSQFMVQNLTVDNACDVLITADAHQDSYLVEASTRYILENKIPQPGEDLWEAFCSSHPILAIKVSNRYIKELTDSSSPPRKKHCADETM